MNKIFCFLIVIIPACMPRGFFYASAQDAADQKSMQTLYSIYGSKPGDSHYIAYKNPSSLNGFRVIVPRFIYKDSGYFAVEAPAKAFRIVSERPDPESRINALIVLNQAKPGIVDTVAVTAEPVYKTVGGERVLKYWTGEKNAALKEFVDGDITVSVSIPLNQSYSKPFALFFPKTIRCVKNMIASMDTDIRPEIKVWLNHVNEPEPIWGKVGLWPNLYTMINDNAESFPETSGFFLRSYYNEQFRRYQPYTVYVPENLVGKKDVPLLILLHGSGGNYMNVIADYAAGQRFDDFPMIIANAGMFTHEEFRHVARNDIVGVLEHTKKSFPIDTQKIFLQGISLGGRGTLEVASLHPDLFAAISAQGVYGMQSNTIDPIALTEQNITASRLSLKSDIRSILPNLTNTPTEILVAMKDRITHPFLGHTFHIFLRRIKAPCSVREFNTGHNLSFPEYDWKTTREWFLSQPVKSKPMTVRLQCANLRFNTSSWVTIHALDDYSRVGGVHADYDSVKNLLAIHTSNVASCTFTPPWPVSKILYNGHDTHAVNWKPPETKGIRMLRTADGTPRFFV
ncbi:MAG: prolyl oligopeptidase family serine peptidase, partial [Chitinivibrionales bacterium]|nr:prolyl oligopeptidase family serine peptidase [Chitinivibrionales bacterium]